MHCSGRLKITLNQDLNIQNKIDIKINDSKITTKHSLKLEEYNYYLNKIIIEYINYKLITYIKRKMNYYNYLYNLIKEENKKIK